MAGRARFSVSVEELLLEQFDSLTRREGFPTRSEAITDCMRQRLVAKEWLGGREVAGAIGLVYDHHRRAAVPPAGRKRQPAPLEGQGDLQPLHSPGEGEPHRAAGCRHKIEVQFDAVAVAGVYAGCVDRDGPAARRGDHGAGAGRLDAAVVQQHPDERVVRRIAMGQA